jgi:arylsulfatase A-like enzyme
MTSRPVLLTAVATILWLMAPAGHGAERNDRKPNIIFIMADDLGYGDLGCYGQKLIQTPRLDRMAAEGTRFRHCYAGAPVCAPSRSVLMTGQHTGHTRVRDNAGRVGGASDEMSKSGNGHRIPLLTEDITVAEVLKKAGYATGITGKWGLGEAGTTGVPNRQGFDEWYGFLNQNHAVFYFTDYLWHNEKKEPIPENQDNRRQKYTHDLFTDFALDFIRLQQARPFFLYVAYTIPHFNLEVPDLGSYAAKDWPENSKIFAAMITRMDRDVGRILDLLKQLGLEEKTLVFFTSDNGSPGAGGPIFNSGGPLKGKKGGLSEGGIRTPMVVRWPGKVPAGKVSDAPWYFADVLPTLAELGGATPPGGIDGISILPTLLGKRQNLSNRYLYWERPPPKLPQAVRWGHWKALRTGCGQPLEIFNLADDPAEEHNLANSSPELVTRFETYLKTARTESLYWPMAAAQKKSDKP